MKAKPQTKKGTLAVTGEGEIKVRPDLAILDLNVVTAAKTAQEAVQSNAERMSAVISALKASSLKPADMQTVGYDVNPVFDSDEKSPTFGQIVEYRVVAQLRVRVDVEQTGQVIDMAIAAGANMASGVRYAVRDDSAVRARALRAAVKAARHDADVVAESLGLRIRDPRTVEINVGGMPIFVREAALTLKSSSTPIEPGTIDVRASVRIVFRCA